MLHWASWIICWDFDNMTVFCKLCVLIYFHVRLWFGSWSATQRGAVWVHAWATPRSRSQGTHPQPRRSPQRCSPYHHNAAKQTCLHRPQTRQGLLLESNIRRQSRIRLSLDIRCHEYVKWCWHQCHCSNTVKLRVSARVAINFRRALHPAAIGGRCLLEVYN